MKTNLLEKAIAKIPTNIFETLKRGETFPLNDDWEVYRYNEDNEGDAPHYVVRSIEIDEDIFVLQTDIVEGLAKSIVLTDIYGINE